MRSKLLGFCQARLEFTVGFFEERSVALEWTVGVLTVQEG